MAFKGDLEAMVLGVLQHGELHGYEIAKRIKQLSEKALSVGEGQLYPALHKLENEGLVSAIWVPQEGKPPRKVYAITDEGHQELAKHREAWSKFSLGIEAMLKPEFRFSFSRGPDGLKTKFRSAICLQGDAR